MTDRTPEQTNETLDRILEISAENTQNIAELHETVARVAGAVEQLALLTDQRLNRQDQLIALLSSYITGVPPADPS